MQARLGGFVLDVCPAPGSDRWLWAASGAGLPAGSCRVDTMQEAQAAAVAHVQAVLYPPRKASVSRGKSTVQGRGLEGAIEAQAAQDAAGGRCWLWRVPSPPVTGADASARVVDFMGVLPGGKIVAIEAKEGSRPCFDLVRLAPGQAAVLATVAAAGGLAGLVIELRGRRWWCRWEELAPRVDGGGSLSLDWLGAHAVEMRGADWLSAAAERPRGEAQGRLV